MQKNLKSIIYDVVRAFFFICVMAFLFGCKKQVSISDIYSKYNSLKVLEPIDSMVFYLDHETTPALRSLEIIKEKDSSYLYFKVLGQRLIKKYHLNDSYLSSTIDLRKESLSSLNDIYACQHISADTLLCGDVIGRLSLIPYKEKDGYPFNFNTSGFDVESKIQFDPTLYPAIKRGSYSFILPNVFTYDYDQNMLAFVDFNNDTVSWHLLPPEQYVKGYFAYKRFAYWNYAYQEEEELFYFNFPNLDSIYIYNTDFQLAKTIGLFSSLKRKPNDPLFLEENPTLAAQNGVKGIILEDRAKQQFIYEVLLHNNHKNQYYRIVGLPISQNLIDLQDPVKSEIRKYSLIVANSKLEYQTEYAIPFNYYDLELKAYFVHDGKLYIQRKIDSEDEIIVDIFDI